MDRIKSKYTLWRVSVRFVKLLSESLKQWRVFLVYAAVLTVISAIFGQWSYSCTGSTEGQFWCYPVYSVALAIFLLSGFLLFSTCAYLSFVYDFYNQSYKNTVFKPMEMFRFGKEKFKCFATMLLFVFCFIGSISLGWLILKKPANPDWRIEFLFFVVLFATAMFPLIAMRFSAVVAYFLQDNHFPSWKMLYEQTKERSYIGVILFLFILLLSVSLFMHTQVYLMHLTLDFRVFVVALFAEYCGYLVKLFCAAAFVVFFRAQYELMEEKEILTDTIINNEEEKPIKSKKKKNKSR